MVRQSKYWKCAVCKKKAERAVFACVGCLEYVHFRCVGKSFKEVKAMDKASIKCNKCMEKDRVSGDSYLSFLNFRSVDFTLVFSRFHNLSSSLPQMSKS